MLYKNCNDYFYQISEYQNPPLTNQKLKILQENLCEFGRPSLMINNKYCRLTEEQATKLITSLFPMTSVREGIFSEQDIICSISGYSKGTPVFFKIRTTTDKQLEYTCEWHRGGIHGRFYIYTGGDHFQFKQTISEIESMIIH
jgi:hypothetical protein